MKDMGGIIRAARSFRLADTLEPVIQSHRLVVNQALVQKDFDSTQGYSIEHRVGKGRRHAGTKGKAGRYADDP